MRYWYEAFHNLMLSRLRSILALIGILVGASAVVTLVSIGEMAKYKALAEFNTLGMDLASLTVNQNLNFNTGIDMTHALMPDYNFSQRVAALKDKVTMIQAVAPVAGLPVVPYFKGVKLQGQGMATSSAFYALAHLQLAQGRFLNPLDRASYFCVLGSDVAQQMKAQGALNLVGKQILLGPAFFTVIGVLQAWTPNPFINNNINGSVIVSLEATHHFLPSFYVDSTLLQLKPDADPDVVQAEVGDFFASEYPGLEVNVKTGKQLIESMQHQKNIFTWMLGLIGGIALLVGGIGIMNVMLVSVAERRKEIGIRLAIGARQRDIRRMFLLESVILSMVGGVLGIIISFFITQAVADFLGWPFMFSWLAITIGFFVSLFTGIFFGWYPAYQASKLNPIDVLRAE